MSSSLYVWGSRRSRLKRESVSCMWHHARRGSWIRLSGVSRGLNLGVWVGSKMNERMSDHVSEMPEISHHKWKNEWNKFRNHFDPNQCTWKIIWAKKWVMMQEEWSCKMSVHAKKWSCTKMSDVAQKWVKLLQNRNDCGGRQKWLENFTLYSVLVDDSF